MTKEHKRILLQLLLFITTFITTTLAGASFTFGYSIFAADEAGGLILNTNFSWQEFATGLPFSIPFLLILTVHEFGHYFMARYHGVKSSLPYYIPFPPLPLPLSIGTMGAVIRLRSRVVSMKHNFDIGIAGPLAGFALAVLILWYGFTHLPPPEYIFQIHPEYEQYGLNYADYVYEDNSNSIALLIGNNLLFHFFETVVADPARVPNPHEIMHYPIIFAGFLALVFTALNLLPIGQLDGGHVVYGLFGFKTHRAIASVAFVLLILYAGLGVVTPSQGLDKLVWYIPAFIVFLYLCFSGLGLPKRDTWMYAVLIFAIQFTLSFFYPKVEGYSGWLLFGLLIGRLIGVRHPPSEIEEPLDTKRIVLGWFALFVFIICFSPAPLVIEVGGQQ